MAVPGKKCLAKFNYVATDSEELTINKGEVLKVVDDKGPWWKVCNQQNKVGLVPSNYVEITAAQMAPPPAAAVAVQQPANNVRTNLKFDEKPNQYQQPDLIKNGPSLNIKAVAKFKYASTREDELSLEKGDDVIVMEKEADGWWRGRCGAKIGWFPFNYVEEVVGNAETSSKGLAPPSFQPTTSTPLPPSTQSKQKAIICGVVALYSFNSGNPEELAFEKGDLLDVIDQPPDDPDWWEARMPDGNTGLVPRNYVEMVHDTSGGGGSAVGSKPPNVAGMAAAAAASRSPAPFAREIWFHGKVARRDAEILLNRYAKNGEFVVRESETKPGDYSISMKATDRIKHFNVKNLQDGRLGIGQRKFDSMDELIQHYRRAPIYTTNNDGKMYLTNGLSKR